MRSRIIHFRSGAKIFWHPLSWKKGRPGGEADARLAKRDSGGRRSSRVTLAVLRSENPLLVSSINSEMPPSPKRRVHVENKASVFASRLYASDEHLTLARDERI